MAKKKHILWGRVFAFFGIILTAFVVFLVSTNSLPSTSALRSLIKPKAATTRNLNVLEIRYFPSDPNGTQLSKTNALSSLLANDITDASRPKGYKDTTATAVVVPVIKRVVTRAKNSPYTTGTGETFYESLKTMLSGDGEDLCAYIAANKIDQVWFWKDVGTDNGGFNQEYFMSWSNTMLPSGGYPPVCNGQRTFLVLGLDQNRTVAEALHSFGHSIEATIPVLQGTDLFWTKWAGGTNPSAEARTCGNVHFPPNTGTGYDYTRGTGISTNCEDWHADGTGTQTNVTCSRWGCNQEGYMKWWLQNTPNAGSGLTYGGKVIPTWWSFLADTDNAILDAAASNQYLTATYASKATPGPVGSPTPTPRILNTLDTEYHCIPQSPTMSICNSNSTTCGKVCRDSSGVTVATCAAGSDCLSAACHPISDNSLCTGTMNASCGMPCRASSDCASGAQCTTIAPANSQVIQRGVSHMIKLVNKPSSSTANYFIFDGVILDGSTVQESQLALYTGTWANNPSAGYSGGNAKFTTQDGASIEFGTTASTLTLISVTHPNVGNVDVYIDDVYRGTIVMTSPTITFQKQYDLTQFYGVSSTPTPAPTVAPTATPSPTAAPGATTITFDDLSSPDRNFVGQYPTGIVDWGSNEWYLSAPWGSFTTNSFSFAANALSKTFMFVTPRKLVSIQAYNGGSTSTIVSVGCTGNTTKTQTVAVGAKATITTGFTKTCTSVTVGSSNGWDTNFDNIIYQ